MEANYEACLAITLQYEGGDSNNPKDPGGKTRWGVTQATYDVYRRRKGFAPKSVFTMDRSEMAEIYRENYWNAVNGDGLGYGVDLATWDYGVNSGPARAHKDLLASVGGSAVDTIKKLCAKRMSLLHGLSTFKTFGKGWSARVAGIEAKGVAMALKASSPATAKEKLLTEADAATSAASAKAKKAVVTAPVSTATMVTATNVTNQWVAATILLGIGAIGVGFILYHLWHARHQDARAAAYAAAAKEV